MRSSIYYWKCDNPVPQADKARYNDKYRLADISGTVLRVVEDACGEVPERIAENGGAGNHYTYTVRMRDGRQLFFRSDDGATDDDYMEAEAELMRLVGKAGVPVPQVHAWDTTLIRYPVRWQLMDCVAGASLERYAREGKLQMETIARQLGRLMARIHSVQLPGFGFINTAVLKSEGRLSGLDSCHTDYFFKCLDRHISFLADTGFLSHEEAKETEMLLQQYSSLAELPHGSLVHKDLALWNLMGTPDSIDAVIDWDDAVIGDPADDFGVLRCFHDAATMDWTCEGYAEVRALPEPFAERTALYQVRNMLWKAMVRTFMGYFKADAPAFIQPAKDEPSLYNLTRLRYEEGMAVLRSL